MEVSPAKSLILSATIHGGSYFFIQPRICDPTSPAHLRERAIFQACLIKMAFSWKCIGRQQLLFYTTAGMVSGRFILVFLVKTDNLSGFIGNSENDFSSSSVYKGNHRLHIFDTFLQQVLFELHILRFSCKNFFYGHDPGGGI